MESGPVKEGMDFLQMISKVTTKMKLKIRQAGIMIVQLMVKDQLSNLV